MCFIGSKGLRLIIMALKPFGDVTKGPSQTFTTATDGPEGLEACAGWEESVNEEGKKVQAPFCWAPTSLLNIDYH